MPIDLEWKDFKRVLIILMKDSCVYMHEKYTDIVRTITNNFEDLMKDLVDLLTSFDKESVH